MSLSRFVKIDPASLTLNRVSSINALKERYPQAAVLALDIEGHGGDIKDIGLALLPSLETLTPKKHLQDDQIQSFLASDGTLKAFVQDHHIRVENIKIRGRNHGREPFKYGIRVLVDPNSMEIEAAVVHALQQFGLGSTPVVCVTFGGSNEMTWIRDHCTGLLQFISAWLDLQDCVESASGLRQVGLRDSMKALGISEQIASRNDRKRRGCCARHSAGNDAVRNLAVLAGLLARTRPSIEEPTQKLPVTRTIPLRLFSHRPPARSYPFTAKLETVDGSTLPLELDTAYKVFRFFSGYEPRTAGKRLLHKMSSSKVDLTRAWIAFLTRKRLESYVTKVNNSIVGGKQLKVTWVLPPGTRATEAEDERPFWEGQRDIRQYAKLTTREEEYERQRDLDLELGIEALFIPAG